ncbi:MAG TPA: hypothetical protein VKE72_04185 [Methylocella sp.]|nr:hypothetical protein [Methylocella sp.]
MLFLLRAIFWLSIVAYFLPWPEDPIASLLAKTEVQDAARDFLDAARDFWGRTVGLAQAAAERECLRAPEACLKASAGLGRTAARHPASSTDKEYGRSPVDRQAPRN